MEVDPIAAVVEEKQRKVVNSECLMTVRTWLAACSVFLLHDFVGKCLCASHN